MKPAHWLPGFDARTQAALDFIDAEIARGNFKVGPVAIAAHLTEVLGVPHNDDEVAGLLDRHGRRETRWWLRQRKLREAAEEADAAA